MEHFSFGDNPEMSKRLLQLVINKKKTGTSWAAVHGDHGTVIGEQMIITDHKHNPKIIIKTTDLKKISFKDVTDGFAHSEGEGDKSLKYWRKQPNL